MPTWLKVILIIMAVGLLGLTAVGVGGYWWVKSNQGRFEEMGKRAKTDAAQFAAGHDGAQCLQEALRRVDAADGIFAKAEVRVFLSSCMDQARESPGMCDGVPPSGEIIQSATWAVDRCAQIGRSGDQSCNQLFQEIQKHCNKRGQRPPP